MGPAVQDVEEETVSREPAASHIEVVDAPLPTDTTLQAASDVSEGMESVGDETAVALGSESTKSQEMPGAERAGTRKPHAAKKGDEGIPETSAIRTTSSQENGADSSDSAPDTSHQNPTPPDASEVLDEMLSSGRFARAYWLARADRSLGAPDLLGRLCEGARIGPGDHCPGILAQFFDALAGKDSWTDGERLLLSAAVLGPCLFVNPLPQGIYQLANQLPVEGSPVGPLMQKVRDLCVYQSTKIRPEDLGTEPGDTGRDARLDALAREAQDFLARVPHMHFAYPPADQALRFLYRAGSDWHRLHVIVGKNRSNRFKEARTLAETLDPANVVASLHDETDLAALTKPLVGSARDKLARHLHNTIGLAREWVRLTEAERPNRVKPTGTISAKHLRSASRATTMSPPSTSSTEDGGPPRTSKRLRAHRPAAARPLSTFWNGRVDTGRRSPGKAGSRRLRRAFAEAVRSPALHSVSSTPRAGTKLPVVYGYGAPCSVFASRAHATS